MLERTEVITNEVLETITFILAYPTVYSYFMGTVSLHAELFVHVIHTFSQRMSPCIQLVREVKIPAVGIAGVACGGGEEEVGENLSTPL